MFYMYNSARFLRFAKEYLGVQVKQDSINQVGEIAQFRHGGSLRTAQTTLRGFAAEHAVLEWLKASNPGSEIIANAGYPDFIVVQADSKRIGFEVKCTPDPRHVFRRGQSIVHRASLEVRKGTLDFLRLVVVTEESSVTVANAWWRHEAEGMLGNIGVIIGVIAIDSKAGTVPVFKPISTIGGQGPYWNGGD
jgi:hypothetical protein